MNKKIIKRIKEESSYILKTNSTIREIAKKFKVSKSTVHQDLSKRLYEIDPQTYSKVFKILEYHIDIRHIRGGESTRKKFLSK